jgi:hypothetical protein
VVQLDYFLELLGKDVTIYGSLLVLLGLEWKALGEEIEEWFSFGGGGEGEDECNTLFPFF